MTILLNGDRADVTEALNVSELAASFGFDTRTALIEHNGMALPPRAWSETTLAEGDRVEIVRVVAGG